MDNNEHGTNLAEVGTDCISREQAIDALVAETIYTEEELKEYYEANSHRNEWVNGIYDAVETIKQLPPIQSKLLQPWEVLVAQAVLPHPEIIRCRECKFASGDSRICMKFGHSPIGELDFCAWAERRTDE